MARGDRPFLFCRYQILFGDEVLQPGSHVTVLQEMQGQRVVHGRSTSEDRFANTLLMRPREHQLGDHQVLTWSAGYETDDAMRAHYDSGADEIDLVPTGVSVRYADFVAVPKLGVMAVDDRVNDTLIGGKAGINRLRSVLRSRDDGDISVVSEATPDEVRKALQNWSLTQFLPKQKGDRDPARPLLWLRSGRGPERQGSR